MNNVKKHFSKDGVEYFQLYIPCPSCIEEGKPTQRSYWTHANCGGELYVGDNAHLYCEKCGKSEIVFKCRYMCPNCSNEYYEVSFGHYSSPTSLLPFLSGVLRNEFCGVRFMRNFAAAFDDLLVDNHIINS